MIARRPLALLSPTRFAAVFALAVALAVAVPAVLRAAGAAKAAGAQPAAAAPAAGGASAARRVEIAAADGTRFPYTIELPAGWEVVHSKAMPGVFVGPAGSATPETDPRMVYVRVSPASLADPEAVVANIKKSVDDSWAAPLVEVRTLGGVRGVLVRMDSGSGIQARSTLVLKMPYGQTSLDFMASATRSEFERQLPVVQRVILSVLPAR